MKGIASERGVNELVNLHLVLGHVVADHSFTNNYKIRSYRGLKLVGHILWSWFALLAFTFDTLLKNPFSLGVLVSFSIIHAFGDVYRVKLYSAGKKRAIDLLELILLILVVIANSLVAKGLKGSYLSAEFVYYLLGMSVVSVGVTYLFRNFYPGVEDLPDVDGISERLAVFVFMLARKPLFVVISLVLGLLWRIWKYRRVDPTWYLSPALGLGLSFLWYLTLYSG